MGKTSAAAVKRYQAKTYKVVEVNLSINDHATLKAFCRMNGFNMSGFIYDILIKEMAARGIRLEGTATRNVDDIINSDVLSAANRTSASDEDCKK